jgi:hypothetical protein
MSSEIKENKVVNALFIVFGSIACLAPVICAMSITPGWEKYGLQLEPATGYWIVISSWILFAIAIAQPGRNLYLIPLVLGLAVSGAGAIFTMSTLLAHFDSVYLKLLYLLGMIGAAPGAGLAFLLMRLQDALFAGSPGYNPRKTEFQKLVRLRRAEWKREQPQLFLKTKYYTWGFGFSLIGCIFFFMPVVGLIFSLGGFFLTRHRTDAVRKLANIGLILSSLATVIGVLAITYGVMSESAANKPHRGANRGVNTFNIPQPPQPIFPPGPALPPAPPQPIATPNVPANSPVNVPNTAAPADSLESYKRSLSDLLSDDIGKQADAVEQLKKIKPSADTSAEMRKELARAYKQVAFDEKRYSLQRVEAIDGMVVWGGNFSVPLLLKLLDSNDHQIRLACYLKLAQLKDPRAIEPVAGQLRNDFCGNEVFDCLMAFGADAEDAVLKNFPKRPDLIERTLDYLEKYGTKKSLPLLKSLHGSEHWFFIGEKVDKAQKVIEKRNKK